MARVAIVTGGTRGIGEAISVALHEAGYKVAANYCGNDERAKAFTARTGIPAYKWDVADFEACQAGVAKVVADLGPVDVVVNNAGITRDGMFHRMAHEQWSEVINTNLSGLFNMTRPVWEGMRERGFGRIVCISSINGQKGQFGQTNYSAAKAGLIGFTKAVAQENAAKGITVNAIAPGYIRTPMTDKLTEEQRDALMANLAIPRLGTPEDIASVVAFLAGPGGSYVTGEVINVSGGLHM